MSDPVNANCRKTCTCDLCAYKKISNYRELQKQMFLLYPTERRLFILLNAVELEENTERSKRNENQ